MKCLKIVKVVLVSFFIFIQILNADVFTVNNLREPKLTNSDINKMNICYSNVLMDRNFICNEVIMMNIIKAKILYPDCKFDCLIKPLQKIVKKSSNELNQDFARTTLVILSSEINITIDESNLYNFDVDKFFRFINNQISELYVTYPM